MLYEHMSEYFTWSWVEVVLFKEWPPKAKTRVKTDSFDDLYFNNTVEINEENTLKERKT